MAGSVRDDSARTATAVQLYVLYRIAFARLFLVLLWSGRSHELFPQSVPLYAIGAVAFRIDSSEADTVCAA